MSDSRGFPPADSRGRGQAVTLDVALAERERAPLNTKAQRLLIKFQEPRTGQPVVIDLANFVVELQAY